jgi:hypothetical protein
VNKPRGVKGEDSPGRAAKRLRETRAVWGHGAGRRLRTADAAPAAAVAASTCRKRADDAPGKIFRGLRERRRGPSPEVTRSFIGHLAGMRSEQPED